MKREETKNVFFIIGMARTGTTLMARIFNQNPNVYFLNETHFMREYGYLLSNIERLEEKNIQKIINQFVTIQRKSYYRKNEIEDYPEEVESVTQMFNEKNRKYLPELLRSLFQYEAARKGKRFAGDQTPNHVFFIDQIIKHFPESKFINMVRDPRAVILSQKNKWKASKRLKQPIYEVIRSKVNYHPITQSILWLKAVKAGFFALKKHSDQKIIVVPYEQLVSYPESTIIKVCDFMGVDFSRQMLNISVSMSSNVSSEEKNGIDATLADKWRNKLSPTEIYIVEKICSKTAEKLGYKSTNVKPNYFIFIIYIIVFPIHVIFAYLLSARRFSNPFRNFIKKVECIISK